MAIKRSVYPDSSSSTWPFHRLASSTPALSTPEVTVPILGVKATSTVGVEAPSCLEFTDTPVLEVTATSFLEVTENSSGTAGNCDAGVDDRGAGNGDTGIDNGDAGVNDCCGGNGCNTTDN